MTLILILLQSYNSLATPDLTPTNTNPNLIPSNYYRTLIATNTNSIS